MHAVSSGKVQEGSLVASLARDDDEKQRRNQKAESKSKERPTLKNEGWGTRKGNSKSNYLKRHCAALHERKIT
jgi:hypothetical protein